MNEVFLHLSQASLIQCMFLMHVFATIPSQGDAPLRICDASALASIVEAQVFSCLGLF